MHDIRFSNPTKISNLGKGDHASLERQCLSVSTVQSAGATKHTLFSSTVRSTISLHRWPTTSDRPRHLRHSFSLSPATVTFGYIDPPSKSVVRNRLQPATSHLESSWTQWTECFRSRGQARPTNRPPLGAPSFDYWNPPSGPSGWISRSQCGAL